MEENTMIPLSDFLKEYGIEEENLTDKEKLDILDRIISRHDVDKEWEEQEYSKIPETSKTKEQEVDFAKKIQNLDIKIINATGYTLMIERKIKKERKLKRKAAFQKVIGVFKRNKSNINEAK